MDEGKYTIHNEGLVQGPIIGDHNIINQTYYTTGTDIPRTSTTEASERLTLLEHSKDPDRDRLFDARSASFVLGTRQNELTQITMLIRQLKTSGGYLTITGQAGEGKTTLITQLIETEFGRGQTAYHIIPLKPPDDHQVTLLRSIMATLALKHSYLPDHWIHVFHRDTLAGIFSNMLFKIAEQGDEEVIFIDGLDQIKPDSSDQRDLDFLPLRLPVGIVIVISARPDDTFNSLALRTPLFEYKLPKLGRADVDRILAHHKVDLAEDIIDRLYLVTQQNAMYVDLVAKELMHLPPRNIEKVLDSVSSNPDNIFAISIERLKQPKAEWKSVIKPLLGLLLAAQEHLSIQALVGILGIDEESVLDGLQRLEGLIEKDGEGKYALYHLKLQEYLKGSETSSVERAYISLQEERLRHKQISDWCAINDASGGEIIWQATSDITEEERRNYARSYYITHLYYANEWQLIFAVLDSAKYGRAKLSYPRTHSFAYDLDLGRKSAAWPGWTLEQAIDLLPRLWRYTYLRCSLKSPADQYPLEAFRLLVLLNRKREALGLAESITSPDYKVKVMGFIANLLKQQSDQERDWLDLFMNAQEIAVSIYNSKLRTKALRSLIHALILAKQWEQAKEVILTLSNNYSVVHYHDEDVYFAHPIDKDEIQAEELIELGNALALAQQKERAIEVWKEAIATTFKIENEVLRFQSLNYFVKTVSRRKLWDSAKTLWQEAETVILSTELSDPRAWYDLLVLSYSLAQSRQWEHAEALICFIKDKCSWGFINEKFQALALGELGIALALAQEWERAKDVIRRIEGIGRSIERGRSFLSQELSNRIISQEARVLVALAFSLTVAQQGEQAEAFWQEAEAMIYRIKDDEMQQVGDLIYLGRALMRIQQEKRAQVIWGKAEAIIDTKMGGSDKAKAKIDLSLALVEAQQFERADAIFNTIKEHKRILVDPRNSKVKLGYALMSSKKWEQAEAIFRTIQNGTLRTKALSDLGSALAKAQEWERAEAIIQSIKYMPEQIRSLSSMVNALIKAQKWEQAEALIHSIDINEEVRAKALCQLGIALARIQRQDQARIIWLEAETILHTNVINLDNYDDIDDIKEHFLRSEEHYPNFDDLHDAALKGLESALTRVQQLENATASWQQAKTLMRDIKDNQIEKELKLAFTRVQQNQSKTEIHTDKDTAERTWNLVRYGREIAARGNYEKLLYLIQRSWLLVKGKEEVLILFHLVLPLIQTQKLALDLKEAFTWVDSFNSGKVNKDN